MIAEISSLLTSTMAAYDIAKGISTLKSEVDRNEQLSKTLDILISVKKDTLSVLEFCEKLQKEKDDLAKKIVDLENWSATKSQYELKEITAGVFVYSSKAMNCPSEPPHWLCAKCFHDKKAHIIQFIEESAAGKHFYCPSCGTKYDIRHGRSPSRNFSA